MPRKFYHGYPLCIWQWRHNWHCVLNRLSRRRSKKTSKLRVTGLCNGNSPVTGEFLAQRASNAEYVSIWWRHHVNNVARYDPIPWNPLLHYQSREVYGQTIRHHYCDVIIGTMASQITNLTIVYSTVYSGTDQRKHQSSASLAFVRGFHRGPVNSPHKGPVMRKMFPFDDVIMHKNLGRRREAWTEWPTSCKRHLFNSFEVYSRSWLMIIKSRSVLVMVWRRKCMQP